jgi:hypothetical protein
VLATAPDFEYYVQRTVLVVELAAGRSGSELKNVQYGQQEYDATKYLDHIGGIADRVRGRLARLRDDVEAGGSMTPAELKALVAEKVGVAVDVVEGVLNTYGVSLQHLDGARSLRLTRLRVVGVKPGPLDPGPFDHTFHFESGVTVITGGNLRGKTSILEICKLMLRGTADDLQGDVRSWLRLVCLDLEVNGQATGLRLRLAGWADNARVSDSSPAGGPPRSPN